MNDIDIKKDNVFIAGFDESLPTLKLGDLELGHCRFPVANCVDARQYAQRALMTILCSRLQCAPCGMIKEELLSLLECVGFRCHGQLSSFCYTCTD
jgi:hypothetical protein